MRWALVALLFYASTLESADGNDTSVAAPAPGVVITPYNPALSAAAPIPKK